jgi:hypothetical protein
MVGPGRRQLIRHDIPAQCKGHSHQGPGKDNAERGAPKGQMIKSRWQTPEMQQWIMWLRLTGHPAKSSEDHSAGHWKAISWVFH